MGVVVRRYIYRFAYYTIYPCSFLQQQPYFLFIKKMFSFLLYNYVPRFLGICAFYRKRCAHRRPERAHAHMLDAVQP